MRERLIELLKECDKLENKAIYGENGSLDFDKWVELYVDYLLANGVVALPCKIGDTAYYIGYLPCHNGETYPSDYNCAGCRDKCDILRTVKQTKIPSLTFIINNFVDHQGMYYLTKGEAEAAFERKNEQIY